MHYTASEVAKKLSVSKDTLRYYEKEDLLPTISRNLSGHRTYTQDDIEWIYLVRCLRDTDMPISKIKQYVSLLKNGGSHSIPQRRDILLEHGELLKEKVRVQQTLLSLIDKKLEFYDDIIANGNSETTECMDYATEWEHFKSILGGGNT